MTPDKERNREREEGKMPTAMITTTIAEHRDGYNARMPGTEQDDKDLIKWSTLEFATSKASKKRNKYKILIISVTPGV